MSTAAKLAADMLRELGDNADDAMVSRFIDTGYPPLNMAISGRYDGGLPQGRMVEMYGESSSGKTALATKWMVEAQKMGGIAAFIDWERSFAIDLAKELGLNDERPYWLYTKPKTWEEGNVYAAKAARLIRASGVIPDEAPILFVFDSIASALPRSQAEKEIDEYTMNDTTALARVTSTTLKAMAQHCEETNSTFLYLNQVRLKPGVVYGDPRTTPGGKAMEFYSTVRMALGRSKIMEGTGSDKAFAGQTISIQCTKSKLTKPFEKVELDMMFDEKGVARFDTVTSLLRYLKDKDLIMYSKPRYTWSDGKQYFEKALAEKIEKEGLYSELVDLLPKS